MTIFEHLIEETIREVFNTKISIPINTEGYKEALKFALMA